MSELFEASVIGAGRPAHIDRVFDYEDVAPVEGAGILEPQDLTICGQVRSERLDLTAPRLCDWPCEHDAFIKDERGVFHEAAVRVFWERGELYDLVAQLTQHLEVGDVLCVCGAGVDGRALEMCEFTRFKLWTDPPRQGSQFGHGSSSSALEPGLVAVDVVREEVLFGKNRPSVLFTMFILRVAQNHVSDVNFRACRL